MYQIENFMKLKILSNYKFYQIENLIGLFSRTQLGCSAAQVMAWYPSGTWAHLAYPPMMGSMSKCSSNFSLIMVMSIILHGLEVIDGSWLELQVKKEILTAIKVPLGLGGFQNTLHN